MALTLTIVAQGQSPKEPGLLFYLSGDKGLTADVSAGGTPDPNFASDVKVIPDGAKGPGLQCAHTQLLSYRAPGNIYAERGTLSLFWRAREPVGPTEFPIFRVGYADHSSWDMVWLRIDYNGKPGFDAFVTDASLARTRVSYAMPAFPKPDQWVHLALSWDETRGIRFYVNGQIVARQEGSAIFHAALDQFGPHSRVISPYQVQSAYNFVRGGDIDELRIYDRMLSDGNIAALSRGEVPTAIPELTRDLQSSTWRDEWWYRYGWNRPGDVPPALDAGAVAIRKVEIHDVYDLKRWWWKGTDGIRETTWPGVYNRSRLPGRNDYFQLPDWDCYSLSGKTVTFTMPDEPWNQVEVSGAAFGSFSVVSPDSGARPLFDRPKGQERTFHRLPLAIRGQRLQFTNVEQETPIGELSVYSVQAGAEPRGIARLAYRLTAAAEPDQPSVKPLVDYINGRYQADERQIMVGLPTGAPRTAHAARGGGLPLVHILIPAGFRDLRSGPVRAFSYTWTNMQAGLDGIAIDLPALKVTPTHGAYFPLNIQVKDPIWPLRNMLDVSISVKPGEAHTVWLDTRDRILPNGKPLYLTIAGAGADFGPAALEGAEVRLIFKPLEQARAEHVLDRFTQVRDNYAQIVEEHPNTRRLNLYTQFETDMTDLLRVDPNHTLGRQYWYDYNKEQPRPPVTLAAAPDGVPLWAFRQIELLRYVKRFVNWYIDNRQIENGELGGGLSDDGDLTNWWPGTALMGANPEKIRRSLLKEMDAFYAEGMFTNGLSTIQADELHSYEEGIQVLGQSLTLDYGSPLQIERAMQTALATERITGINRAGHRHIRSSYFSGTKIAEDSVWGWSKPSSYLVMHPAMLLVEFNGAPKIRKWLLELADGLLAHAKTDAAGNVALPTTIHFASDEALVTGPSTGGGIDRTTPLLWAAYRWTGDRKYLKPYLAAGPRSLSGIGANALDLMGMRAEWGPQILKGMTPENTGGRTAGGSRHFAWQVGGDTRLLERLYTEQAENARLREYINTDGSLWIDRVTVEHGDLQRARLGGVALERNSIYPGHVVSWDFAQPDADERVAILVREATPQHVRLVAYNLDTRPVVARMTGWDIDPGSWEISQGTGPETGDSFSGDPAVRTIALERTAGTNVIFPPRATTVIDLALVTKGVPYWSRFDLGISEADVRVEGRTMKVTVHSVGAADAPASKLVLRGRDGRVIASAAAPALKAPLDLVPKTATVSLPLPAGADWKGGSVTIETGARGPEITRRNNVVRF
ncbi:MAG TPA: LamG-like jellyroll fold domain-containing protein [Vicinamibacterales bacterium]